MAWLQVWLRRLLRREEGKAPPQVLEEPPLRWDFLSPEAVAAGELERAARSAYRKGRYEECIELARRALSYDASNLFAYHYLGLALAQLGRWEAAEEAFRRAQEHADPMGLSEIWLQHLAQWKATGQPPPAWAEVPIEEGERDGWQDSGGGG